MWLLWSSRALAASFFLGAGTDHTLVGGGWANAFPADEGWSLLFAAGGGYWLLPMADDMSVVDRSRLDLTDRSDLQDHAVAICPDGTYVHVASASGGGSNDTAWLFRYDASWARTQAVTILEDQSALRTNDMAVTCSPLGPWVGFSGVSQADEVFHIEADGSLTSVVESRSLPQLMGGSLVYEAERGTVMAVGRRYGDPLTLVRIAADGTLTGDRFTPALAGKGEDAYWPSSWERIGDYFVLAYMWRLDDGSFEVDEGNIRLAVFDLDWNLRETFQVTSYSAPNGCMRPALALKDDQLLVLWDRDTVPHGTTVTLNLDAFGVEAGDSGDSADTGDTGDTGDSGDSGTTGDSGDSAAGDSGDTGDSGVDTDTGDTEDDGYHPRNTDADATGCGCASGGSGGASAALAGLALAALVRRRGEGR